MHFAWGFIIGVAVTGLIFGAWILWALSGPEDEG